ncbi:hypothetical protein ACFWD7_29510 [Streptomyces mirabilis]|uniref:hypothetical protein n=1 Tax=Streptomyces mirabilis TaxID=68239 RepID=UPI0036970E47
MDDVINGGSHSTAPLDGCVGDVVAPGAAIVGIMNDARTDAIREYDAASDAEFNEAAASKQKRDDRILGMGIEKVGERIPHCWCSSRMGLGGHPGCPS